MRLDEEGNRDTEMGDNEGMDGVMGEEQVVRQVPRGWAEHRGSHPPTHASHALQGAGQPTAPESAVGDSISPPGRGQQHSQVVMSRVAAAATRTPGWRDDEVSVAGSVARGTGGQPGSGSGAGAGMEVEVEENSRGGRGACDGGSGADYCRRDQHRHGSR